LSLESGLKEGGLGELKGGGSERKNWEPNNKATNCSNFGREKGRLKCEEKKRTRYKKRESATLGGKKKSVTKQRFSLGRTRTFNDEHQWRLKKRKGGAYGSKRKARLPLRGKKITSVRSLKRRGKVSGKEKGPCQKWKKGKSNPNHQAVEILLLLAQKHLCRE